MIKIKVGITRKIPASNRGLKDVWQLLLETVQMEELSFTL